MYVIKKRFVLSDGYAWRLAIVDVYKEALAKRNFAASIW